MGRRWSLANTLVADTRKFFRTGREPPHWAAHLCTVTAETPLPSKRLVIRSRKAPAHMSGGLFLGARLPWPGVRPLTRALCDAGVARELSLSAAQRAPSSPPCGAPLASSSASWCRDRKASRTPGPSRRSRAECLRGAPVENTIWGRLGPSWLDQLGQRPAVVAVGQVDVDHDRGGIGPCRALQRAFGDARRMSTTSLGPAVQQRLLERQRERSASSSTTHDAAQRCAWASWCLVVRSGLRRRGAWLPRGGRNGRAWLHDAASRAQFLARPCQSGLS